MKKSSAAAQLEKANQVVKEGGKMTAVQKLESLEAKANLQEKQIQVMAEEIDRLSNVVSAVAKRVNAIVRSGDEGQQIGSKAVTNMLVADAAKELEGKVDFLVSKEVLERNDTKDIDSKSFVVGRELNSEGEVINPRVQFAVLALEDEGQQKVLGKKKGDVITGEDGINMEILEIYDIKEKTQE